MIRVHSGMRLEFNLKTLQVIPDVVPIRWQRLDGSRVRRADKSLKLLESLILAQDERWRRA